MHAVVQKWVERLEKSRRRVARQRVECFLRCQSRTGAHKTEWVVGLAPALQKHCGPKVNGNEFSYEAPPTPGLHGLQLPWCSAVNCDRFWCRCSPYFASRPLSGPRSIWLSNIAIVSRLHGLGITSWDTRVAVGTLRGSERGGSIIPPRDARVEGSWQTSLRHGRSERGGMSFPARARTGSTTWNYIRLEEASVAG